MQKEIPKGSIARHGSQAPVGLRTWTSRELGSDSCRSLERSSDEPHAIDKKYLDRISGGIRHWVHFFSVDSVNI